MTFNPGDFVVVDKCVCESYGCYPTGKVGIYRSIHKDGEVQVDYGKPGIFNIRVRSIIRLATQEEKNKALFFYATTGYYNEHQAI